MHFWRARRCSCAASNLIQFRYFFFLSFSFAREARFNAKLYSCLVVCISWPKYYFMNRRLSTNSSKAAGWKALTYQTRPILTCECGYKIFICVMLFDVWSNCSLTRCYCYTSWVLFVPSTDPLFGGIFSFHKITIFYTFCCIKKISPNYMQYANIQLHKRSAFKWIYFGSWIFSI